MKITDWTARRSGATMTINGRDEKGAPKRIVDVAEIRREGAAVVAVNVSGIRHELA